MCNEPSKLPVLIVEERDSAVHRLLCEQELVNSVTRIEADRLLPYLKGGDAAAIILDLDLPRGLELLGRLSESSPQIPVIALSADPELAPGCRELGVIDHLSLPLSGERVGESLRNALSVRCLNQVATLLRNTPCRHDARSGSSAGDDGGPVRFRIPEDVPPRLRQAVDYLENNLSKPLSLETIAGKACLSKYHFSREFKRYLGMSPIRFMMTRRICHATLLLQNTAFSISRVALQSGFSDQSEFTKWFKRTTGFTPSWYRKSFGTKELQYR